MSRGLPTAGVLSICALAVNAGCRAREFNPQEGADVFDAAKNPAYWSDFSPHSRSAYSQKMKSLLDASADANTVWSVDVRLYGPSGQKVTLYARDNMTRVRPASTLKIFTTWAYFHLFPEVLEGRGAFADLQTMMKESDNAIAEAKMNEAVRRAGSRDKVMKIFKDHGIGDLLLADGSGLSYDSRVHAWSLQKTLTTIKDGIYQSTFEKLLPIGGVDGTLDDRTRLAEQACGARIIAKTGTLQDDPSTDLAGFAKLAGGWQLVFVFLGDSPRSVDAGRAAIDGALCTSVSEAARFFAKAPVARSCPAGYSLVSVNSGGGTLCSDGQSAMGPFSEAMRVKCLEWSPGDPVCSQERWAFTLAKNAYGTGACPRGTSFDDETGYCVEGGNAFGPFPAALIEKCRARQGGSACDSIRWSQGFLKGLLGE